MKKLIPTFALLCFAASSLAGPPVGYNAKVSVGAPTRIDWTFVVSNQSQPNPPADYLGKGYDSTKQQYELFVPPNYDPKQKYPVILFISPGDGAGGWKNWEPVCKKNNVIFASPYGAGNNVPSPKRVRIVLDVLDDIRRNYSTDPDRTYVSGFSGGGRIACGIAFALPEYVGGAVPVCAAGDLREERWLQHRLADRLSVAMVTGENDFNRAECERMRGPLLTAIGVRNKVWTVPKLGHGIPDGGPLGEAYTWLEQDLVRRQALAKKFPSTRIAGDAAPTRDQWAKLMLDEGKQKIGAKDLYPGLMVLQGCMIRWNGTPPSVEARKILEKYDNDKSWEPDDIADQRRMLIALARSLSDYASGPLPNEYAKSRPQWAKEAMGMWVQIIKDGQDATAVEEGKKRLPELQKLAEGK